MDYIKRYAFGFSLGGLIICLLVMAPNIVWMLAPPANDPLAANSAVWPWLDIAESIARFATMISLVFVVNRKSEARTRTLAVSAAVCLGLYYVLWGLYFAGMASSWALLGMAVFPSCYFVLSALWMRNGIAALSAGIFGIAHIAITCGNYL